jgi:hypothetical protein
MLSEVPPLFPGKSNALLAELGIAATVPADDDIQALKHVRTNAEKRAAEEIAKREPCRDFEEFKPLFLQVQQEIKAGVREARRFEQNANIEKGELFILSGQLCLVAVVGELFVNDYDRKDRRLRVIYDNGTEQDILFIPAGALQRRSWPSCYKPLSWSIV